MLGGLKAPGFESLSKADKYGVILLAASHIISGGRTSFVVSPQEADNVYFSHE